MIDLENLKAILDQYDRCHELECDGMTRVVHTVLIENEILHKVMFGKLSMGEQVINPHLWIELDDYIIDYRARMWLGDDAPHGVFVAADHPNAEYYGKQIEMLPLGRNLFKILTGNIQVILVG